MDLKPWMSSEGLNSFFVCMDYWRFLSVYCHFAVVERNFLCLKQFFFHSYDDASFIYDRIFLVSIPQKYIVC